MCRYLPRKHQRKAHLCSLSHIISHLQFICLICVSPFPHIDPQIPPDVSTNGLPEFVSAKATPFRKGSYHVAFGIIVDRNRITHILNGNIRMIVANTNGILADGRWENILNRCEDITLLSETH